MEPSVGLEGVILRHSSTQASTIWRRIFECDGNTRTANFYRFWDEVPTILLLIIVRWLAKPF
jgi:uncharacterized membrane protein